MLRGVFHQHTLIVTMPELIHNYYSRTDLFKHFSNALFALPLAKNDYKFSFFSIFLTQAPLFFHKKIIISLTHFLLNKR